MSQTKLKAGGFDVDVISGTTALAAQPASDDEIVISDGGTLKRLDIKHIQCTPSFQAKLASDQTIGTASWTKLSFATESWDTDGTFASNKFTPAVAGKYQFNIIAMFLNANTEAHRYMLALYKNGSYHVSVGDLASNDNAAGDPTNCFSMPIESDDDDYFEAYIYQNTGGNVDVESDYSFFTAYRLAGV